MSYASDEDIELAAGGETGLVELADWDGDGEVDENVIARAKEAADGVIDGHLRLRLSPADLDRLRAEPTPTLSELAASEAVYWMKKSGTWPRPRTSTTARSASGSSTSCAPVSSDPTTSPRRSAPRSSRTTGRSPARTPRGCGDRTEAHQAPLRGRDIPAA